MVCKGPRPVGHGFSLFRDPEYLDCKIDPIGVFVFLVHSIKVVRSFTMIPLFHHVSLPSLSSTGPFRLSIRLWDNYLWSLRF